MRDWVILNLTFFNSPCTARWWLQPLNRVAKAHGALVDIDVIDLVPHDEFIVRKVRGHVVVVHDFPNGSCAA